MGRPDPELIASIVVRDPWDFSCPDWKQRLSDGRSLVPELPLDPELVRRAVGIFNNLRLPDVADQPRLRDAAGDWQRDVVAALFGSIDDEGIRRVREALVLVPKKNSKTTGGGAIMVTALLMDPVPRQPYYLLGPTQEIAQRGFDQAAGMIEADPVLRKRFLIREHLKTIVDLRTKSFLKIQTFDEKVATGGIPKGLLIDEVHILGKMPYAARVLGQLRGGLVAKLDGFMVMITTQSDQPPAGVFRNELQIARAIRDGRLTGVAANMLPVLYEFPEEVQTDRNRPWENSKTWHMVLPNLGRSCHLSLLEADYASAKEKGEEEIRRWASQHLNIEIGLGLHSERWRGADYWEAAKDDSIQSLDDLLERCEVAVVGIDGGGLDDLLGLCVAGRERDTQRWLFWFHAWAHRSVLELRKVIAAELQGFADDGDLTFWDDGDEDIKGVADVVEKVAASGLMPEKDAIGLDPQGVGVLLDELSDREITEDQMTAIGQGFRLSSAVWSMERKLQNRTAAHLGGRLMAFCVGNAKAEQRGNAVLITKEAAGKCKIDPLIAGFNAVKLLERNPVAAAAGKLSIDDWIEGMRTA